MKFNPSDLISGLDFTQSRRETRVNTDKSRYHKNGPNPIRSKARDPVKPNTFGAKILLKSDSAVNQQPRPCAELFVPQRRERETILDNNAVSPEVPSAASWLTAASGGTRVGSRSQHHGGMRPVEVWGSGRSGGTWATAEPEHGVRGRTWSAMMTNWAGSGREPCQHGGMEAGRARRAGADSLSSFRRNRIYKPEATADKRQRGT